MTYKELYIWLIAIILMASTLFAVGCAVSRVADLEPTQRSMIAGMRADGCWDEEMGFMATDRCCEKYYNKGVE